MAQIAEPREIALAGSQPRTRDSVMATSVIGAHTLEHIYGRGFLVLIPAIYTALGLAPIQAGLLDAVRHLSGGVTSTGGGFLVDLFQHRRAEALAFSMSLIGVGFFLVAISPSYGLMLAALAVASAGMALWHPPALGLLAQRFPRKRGLVISLHRSTGNFGDWMGPLIVGGLLAVMGWRWILGGGMPLAILLALGILVTLGNLGGPKPLPGSFSRNMKTQLSSLREAFKGSGMWAVLAVSSLRGMGDRSLFWVIPLYLARPLDEGGLDKSGFWVAFHVALLAAPGIISGPLFGVLSDRIGRKPIIIFLMGVAVVLPVTLVLGGGGIFMTLSVALFGLFLFSVNSLTQAAAIDVAAGRGLEGTFIGLMWGSNSFFAAASSVVAGALVGLFDWQAAFYFAASLFFLGFLASLILPSTGKPKVQTG